jgi:hypothetical protein
VCVFLKPEFLDWAENPVVPSKPKIITLKHKNIKANQAVPLPGHYPAMLNALIFIPAIAIQTFFAQVQFDPIGHSTRK